MSDKNRESLKLYNFNGAHYVKESFAANQQRYIFKLEEKLQALEKQLEQKDRVVKDLKKAVAFSRQFYYLPQEVLDIFSVLVKDRSYDKVINREFYSDIMSRETGEKVKEILG